MNSRSVRRHPIALVGCVAVLALFGQACSHSAVREGSGGADLSALLRATCDIGASTREATGSVWIKAESVEASGSFPANVKASAPAKGNLKLDLEVTNLVGGVEALIHVDGQRYTLQSQKGKTKAETGYGAWGGIPLRWATDLFVGRIPCPSDLAGAKLSRTDDGQLEAAAAADLSRPAERYVYKFRALAGAPWPEALHWERISALGKIDAAVDFKFDDPDDKTRSPRKWEAHSERGEVRVRWKDRETRE